MTTDGSGQPAAGVLVVAVTPAGVYTRGTVTDESGDYSLGLQTGTYHVQFVDPSGRHRNEWFDDRGVNDFAGSSPVTIGGGGTVSADAALVPSGASGSIGGTVRESGSDAPVPGAWVLAVAVADGAISGGALTGGDGTYVVGGLVPGNYRLAVLDPTMAHAYDLFFDDKADFATGDDIAVSAGATTTVDPDLDPAVAPAANATIAGTITDEVSGDPVAGAWVAAVNTNTGVFTAATVADTAGRYTLRVPAGLYKLEFLDASGGHAGEWFDDKALDDVGGATPVPVAAAGTATVNEDLFPLTGAIAGTVTQTGTVVPVPGAWVVALRAADAVPVGMGTADDRGEFRIGGLDPGHYQLAVVDPAGANETELFYRDQATFLAGDSTEVTGGGTTDIDPDLDSLAPTVSQFTATLSDTNLITLTWRTQGGDPSNLLYIWDNAAPSNPATGFRAQNGTTSFRVTAPGVRRFQLAINSPTGVRRVVPASVSVPFPTAPVITSGPRIDVDEFAKQDVTITWRHDTGGFARVTRPNGTRVDVIGTPSGSTVTGSYLVTAASQSRGRNQYAIAYCKITPDPSAPLCTAGAKVDVMVGPARFTGDFRQYVTPGQTVTLRWTGGVAGRSFNVVSSRLGLDEWVTGTSLPVTVPSDAAGVYDITLASCVELAGQTTCANRDDVTTPSAGTVASVVPVGTFVFAGGEVATVTTPTGTVKLTAPRLGIVSSVIAPVGTSVAAGAQVVAVAVPDTVEHQQLVVSDRPWTTRPLTDDFESGPADRVPVWPYAEAGSPLDVIYSSDGDLWVSGEFGWAMARWTGSSLETYTVPLLAKPDSNARFLPVTPFSYAGRPRFTRISALSERVIEVDGDIWFTQGGGLFSTLTGNASRVLRFDPSGFDLPSTEHDDRYCAVNVPNDGAETIGLAYDGERIWFTEGGLARTTSVDSFDPDELPCENMLDYNDEGAIAQSVHRYCTQPDEAGCIRRIEIPGGLGAALLTFDPTEGAIWATEFYGAAIARIGVDTGAVQRWVTPPPNRPCASVLCFGGAPWQIRADADYVYYIDYFDSDLVRFHKDSGTFEEIPLPIRASSMAAHSIELDGDKLWFTLHGSEDADVSAIGYVDTDDWGPGVVYTGLSTLVDADRASLGPALPGGIAVSPTGDVAVADYFRRQLIILRPRG